MATRRKSSKPSPRRPALRGGASHRGFAPKPKAAVRVPGQAPSSASRLHALLDRIDARNREDPHTELIGGVPQPRELAYARRLTDWVLTLHPEASEALRIAARGQHIRRWTIPRERYPRNRQGYLTWRETLKTFHAQQVGELMRQAGYPEGDVERVQRLMSKRALPSDPETQTLEDALCLVFLDTQFSDLRKKEPEEKMREILRKTWQKMSPRAREAALALPLGREERALLRHALGPEGKTGN